MFDSTESPVRQSSFVKKGVIDGLIMYGGDSSDEDSSKRHSPTSNTLQKDDNQDFKIEPIEIANRKERNEGKIIRIINELNSDVSSPIGIFQKLGKEKLFSSAYSAPFKYRKNSEKFKTDHQMSTIKKVDETLDLNLNETNHIIQPLSARFKNLKDTDLFKMLKKQAVQAKHGILSENPEPPKEKQSYNICDMNYHTNMIGKKKSASESKKRNQQKVAKNPANQIPKTANKERTNSGSSSKMKTLQSVMRSTIVSRKAITSRRMLETPLITNFDPASSSALTTPLNRKDINLNFKTPSDIKFTKDYLKSNSDGLEGRLPKTIPSLISNFIHRLKNT